MTQDEEYGITNKKYSLSDRLVSSDEFSMYKMTKKIWKSTFNLKCTPKLEANAIIIIRNRDASL